MSDREDGQRQKINGEFETNPTSKCRLYLGSKALAARLQKALPYIIAEDQCAFVKGGATFDALRSIDSVMEYTKLYNRPGLLTAFHFKRSHRLHPPNTLCAFSLKVPVFFRTLFLSKMTFGGHYISKRKESEQPSFLHVQDRMTKTFNHSEYFSAADSTAFCPQKIGIYREISGKNNCYCCCCFFSVKTNSPGNFPATGAWSNDF